MVSNGQSNCDQTDDKKSEKKHNNKILKNETFKEDQSQTVEESDDYSENLSSKLEVKKESNKFYETVIKYLKIDDLIREKQTEYREELKTLKDDKNLLEDFIIRYLDKIDENFINIEGKGKLIKNKSSNKVAIKADLIKKGIEDVFRKKKNRRNRNS